jgi:long-chain acyl-CoA synthetase
MALTIPQRVLSQLDNHPDNPALSSKVDGSYQAISSRAVAGRIRAFASSLLALGVEPGERVAIMAPNGPDWVYADQGGMAVGAVTVPVYHTEGLGTLLYVLQNSGSRILFLRSFLMARELAERLDEVPELETVVLLGGGLEHERFIRLEDFLKKGHPDNREELNKRLELGKPDDVATLAYTSGTTGQLKGVTLTHANILSNVAGAGTIFDVGPGDVCLSFLPLSHTFERIDGYYFMLLQGVTIAYAESVDTVPQNLVEVKPTVVVSVPRLYEKMYARVMERVLQGPAIRKQLFFAALRVGSKRLQTRLQGKSPGIFLNLLFKVMQLLVFAKLYERLGGRLRFFISGGAPLVQNVAEFFLSAGITICEGYGLTETGGGIVVNKPEAIKVGTVGQAFPDIEMKIAEDGEVLLRGKGVFSGYWQMHEDTGSVFVDGWFKSGDVGSIDDDGYLTITDRKKDLIITAGGENVAPQSLENLFKSDKFLSNALVYGDRKPYLVALLVPNFENLEQYAHHKEVDYLNECGLVSHPQILDLIRRRIDKLQAEEPAFNQIKRFTLLSRDFSADVGEVTPTMKIKRRVITQRFSHLLEGMYLARGYENHDSGFCVIDDRDESVSTGEQL